MSEDKQKILNLINKTGYNFSLTNGQRLYGPPPNWIGPPPKDTEVFIGKLPNDVYEYDLVPIFSTVGKIYMLRLMQNFSGLTRRFAFVQYTTPEEAKKAIDVLNNIEIRPGEQIGVVKSRNNCRLYIGNLSTSLTREEVLAKMKSLANDVIDLYFNTPNHSEENSAINRGYAFVEFSTHKAAALARRKLVPCKIVLNNQEITVDWATPITELGENLKVECTLLFKNFRSSVSNEQIHDFMSARNKMKIVKLKRIPDQALISFETKHETELALKIFEGMKKSYKFILFKDVDKRIELLQINENMDLRRFKNSFDFISQNFSSTNQPTTSYSVNDVNSIQASRRLVSTSHLNNICNQFNELNINNTPCKSIESQQNNRVDDVDSILKVINSENIKKIYNFSSTNPLYNPETLNNNPFSNANYQKPFGYWQNEDYYNSTKLNIFSQNTQANQTFTNETFFNDFDNIFRQEPEENSEDKSNDYNNNELPDFF